MSKAVHLSPILIVIAVGIGITQAASSQEEKKPKNYHEIPYTITLSTTPPDEQKCVAQIYFEYRQKDTVAVVDSSIGNTDCGASSGSYSVLIRFKDENNEIQSREYPETWQRDNGRAIESRKEYFMGDNVDLVTIRSRKLRCICDKAGAEEEAPE